MREVHVHPAGDLIEHELTGECPCGPESRREELEDGQDGWLIIHHSLDGREEEELPAIALEPGTLPNRPLTADQVEPLIEKEIG